MDRETVKDRRKGGWWGRGGAGGGACWCLAGVFGASGVVEVLQQCASPLLCDVHLILQILQDDRYTGVSTRAEQRPAHTHWLGCG